MTTITLVTNFSRISKSFASDTTLRDVLAEFNVGFQTHDLMLNGTRLSQIDLDETLDDLGVGEEARLGAVDRKDNA